MRYNIFDVTKKILPLIVIGIITIATGILLSSTSPLFKRILADFLGTKAEFTVNLTNSYDVPNFSWNNFAQGGEEKENMLRSVIPQVKTLKPNYIRIDHVYDFYEPVKRGTDGKLFYDWVRLDNEIKNIRDTGALPFISLSYMPPALASGNEVSNPNNWSEWQDLIKTTIEHISGKSGLGIANVYYEVWNEPDLFGDFKLSGEKNYLNLYLYAAKGAQSTNNVYAYKIGGPAITSLRKDWIEAMLSYTKAHNLPLDFISWHRYSLNIRDYEADFDNARIILANYPEKQVEMIIGESGPDSEINNIYDEYFSAIHSLALSTVAFNDDSKIFTFEVKDGPGDKMYWGRWGLLTHEKFGQPAEKPRFKAFSFLNQIKGKRYVVFGQGSWVRSIVVGSPEKIQMLLVNYSASGNHSETVPIHFINIPFKNFKYSRVNFYGGVTSRTVNLAESNWTTYEDLSNNSAAILELTPIETIQK